MLKQLYRFQLIGLALIWVGVGGYFWWFQPTKNIQKPKRATRVVAPIPGKSELSEVKSISSPPEIKAAPLNSGLTFPVADHDGSNIISYYGDKRGKSRLHQGVDIKAPRHTPVVAVADGYVEKIRDSGSGGKVIYLRTGNGMLYYYAHLEDWTVAEFDAVEQGDQIGTVGDSGNAKGTTPHLHFEILKGKERVAIDPHPYLVNITP